MNARRLTMPVVALALAAFGATKQVESGALAKRVDALEAQLEEVQGYLQAQADSAVALSKALILSEEQGFTAGMNFESRFTMLNGFHAHIDTLVKNVPGDKAKADPKGSKPN